MCSGTRTMGRGWLWWVSCGFLLAIFPIIASEAWVLLVTEFFIMALFATAYNIMLGYTGRLSFGHAAFYAMGAYSLTLLSVKASIPVTLAFITSPIAASLAALIIGWFCVRLTSLFFALLTLAFGQLVWVIIWKWFSFTGGDTGIAGIKVPTILLPSTNYYYFTLLVVVACIFIIRMILNSPFGLMIRLIRDNEERVEFIGINSKKVQLVAFTISAFFSGISGALTAILTRGSFPEYAFWTKSAEIVMATILGGMYSFFGPALGAAIIMLLHNLITTWTEYWSIIMGFIFLFLVLLLPTGIAGFVQGRFRTLLAGREAKL